MSRRSQVGLLWMLLSIAALCCAGCFGSHDDGGSGGDSDGKSGDGDGDAATIDPDCVEDCIDKGVDPGECEGWCTVDGTDPKGSKIDDVPGTGTTGGEASDIGGDGERSPAGLDIALEKNCIGCWEDGQNNGECADEVKACEDSLACTQLSYCPTLCGDPKCVPECDEVIPSGVEPLRALVQCIACNRGPCADACEGSEMLHYCE